VWDGAVVAALWLDAAARAFRERGGSDDDETLLPWRALRSRGVLELGAGTGLAGLAAAAALRCPVTLTDLPAALPALSRNVAANVDALAAVAAPPPRVAPLDWCALSPAALAAATPPAAPPALLLAADCVWLPELVAPFVAALDALATAPDTRLLLVYHSRSAAVDATLWGALAAARFVGVHDAGEGGDGAVQRPDDEHELAPMPQRQPRGAEAAAARVYLLRRAAADHGAR
jgi:predicted nicotinamide N-methyase